MSRESGSESPFFPETNSICTRVADRFVNGMFSTRRVIVGLFRRNDGEPVLLPDNMGAEVSFWKDQVEEQSTWFASIMPEGFGDSLPADGLIDLLGYLLQQASP